MAYMVLWCEDASMAVLVSDDPLVALGPVIVADTRDEATEALTYFIEGIPQDVDTVPYAKLIQDWSLYVAALYGAAGGDDRDKQDVSAPTVAGPSSDGAITAGSGSTPLMPVPSETASGTVEPDDTEGDGWAAHRVLESEAREAAEKLPPPGQVQCWACKGSGAFDLPTGPVDCSACGGTGYTAAT